MLDRLSLPKIRIGKGGRVMDCIFSPEGWIIEIWITLDDIVTEIEFISAFKVVHDCKIHQIHQIHLNTVGEEAKEAKEAGK